MIDLYTWTTPNGRKISIALEEMGLPYTVHAVDISKDEQFKPEFLKISPNNRIPAIVDRDNGLSLMESGAILTYLGDKTGKLLPKSGDKRWKTIEWLNWQMGGLGPMLGQVHHYTKYNPGKAPYAEERYLKEGAPALRRDEQAARRPRISRRRLFDRRHRLLAVGVALRVADRRSEAVSERAALVSRHRQQARDAEGLQGAEGRRRRADPEISAAALRPLLLIHDCAGPASGMTQDIFMHRCSKIHYGWIVVGITCLVLLTSAGIRSTPGILMVPLENEFHWSRATIALAVSINLILYGCIGPFAAAVMERFGIRRSVLCALALVGVGVASTSLMRYSVAAHPDVGLPGRHRAPAFSPPCCRRPSPRAGSRRGAASWSASCRGGASTGQLLFLPVMANVTAAYGWRATVLCIAARRLRRAAARRAAACATGRRTSA